MIVWSVHGSSPLATDHSISRGETEKERKEERKRELDEAK